MVVNLVVRIFDRMESAYGLVSNSGSFENSKKQKDKELEAREGWSECAKWLIFYRLVYPWAMECYGVFYGMMMGCIGMIWECMFR